MKENVWNELDNLDRDGLVERMAAELPDIRKRLGLGIPELSEKVGMDEEALKSTEEGKRRLEWSEYMGILFVLWRNEIGKGIVESKGLFPDVLKAAMSVNRNAHAPVTESAKFGF